MSARILLVDDERDITAVLKAGLEKNGYQVDGFTDSREALSHFKPDYYKLLLLDVKMPFMNGFELSRELVKLDSKPKVCFMTAFEVNLNEAQTMFPTLKADAFLKKPFTVGELLKVLGDTLDSHA